MNEPQADRDLPSRAHDAGVRRHRLGLAAWCSLRLGELCISNGHHNLHIRGILLASRCNDTG